MVIMAILRKNCKRLFQMDNYMKYDRGVKMKRRMSNGIHSDNSPVQITQPFKKPASDNQGVLSLENVLNKYVKNITPSEIQLFANMKVITVDYRCKILTECGFKKISIETLTKFLPLVSKTPINELKKAGFLDKDADMQNQLVECFSLWPTSPPMSEVISDNTTILDARMRVLSRYLELKIDLPPETFKKYVAAYQRIKYRPLSQINGVLDILQNCIMISDDKIIKNFGILHVDLDNLRKILEIRSLAGVDIREIIKKKPILINVNYRSFQNIQKLLIDEGISVEAQRKCYEIYTLGYETVKRRLHEIKEKPEFQCYLSNLRVLRLVFYKSKVDQRIEYLKKINKACISLHVLTGPNCSFDTYVNSFGDKTTGRDNINYVCAVLENKYSISQVEEAMRRHSLYNKVPITNFCIVHDNLKSIFSAHDIFLNCHILLYQWYFIKQRLLPLLRLYENEGKHYEVIPGHSIDMNSVTKAQILSLTLYLLEKETHFNGTGILKTSKKNS